MVAKRKSKSKDEIDRRYCYCRSGIFAVHTTCRSVVVIGDTFFRVEGGARSRTAMLKGALGPSITSVKPSHTVEFAIVIVLFVCFGFVPCCLETVPAVQEQSDHGVKHDRLRHYFLFVWGFLMVTFFFFDEAVLRAEDARERLGFLLDLTSSHSLAGPAVTERARVDASERRLREL